MSLHFGIILPMPFCRDCPCTTQIPLYPKCNEVFASFEYQIDDDVIVKISYKLMRLEK